MEAAAGVLRAELPAGGTDRAALRGAARPPRALRRRHPPPHPLPRLLRQGVRRVGAAERDGRGRGGEGRGAKPDAARVRVPGPRQGAPRARLPRRRLLRRRPRSRRARRHRRTRRSVLAGADGAARRAGVGEAGGAGPGPGAHHELHRPPRLLPKQGPRATRPRLALRGAHHRHRPLRLLQRAPVQLHGPRRRRRRRPVAGPGLRGEPAADQVRHADGQHHHRGDGPRELPHLRPRLLPRPAQAPGPLPVRPRAAHGRGGAGRRRERRRRPAGGVLPAVRAVHGQDGHGGRQDRRRGRDQAALRRRQRLVAIGGSARARLWWTRSCLYVQLIFFLHLCVFLASVYSFSFIKGGFEFWSINYMSFFFTIFENRK